MFDYDDSYWMYITRTQPLEYHKPRIYSKIWGLAPGQNQGSQVLHCWLEENQKNWAGANYYLFCSIHDSVDNLFRKKFIVSKDADNFSPIFTDTWVINGKHLYMPNTLFYLEKGCLYAQLIEFRDNFHLKQFAVKVTSNFEDTQKFILTKDSSENYGVTNIAFSVRKNQRGTSEFNETVGVVVHVKVNGIGIHVIEKVPNWVPSGQAQENSNEEKYPLPLRVASQFWWKEFTDDAIVGISGASLDSNGKFVLHWSQLVGGKIRTKLQIFKYVANNWIDKETVSLLEDHHKSSAKQYWIGLHTQGNLDSALSEIQSQNQQNFPVWTKPEIPKASKYAEILSANKLTENIDWLTNREIAPDIERLPLFTLVFINDSLSELTYTKMGKSEFSERTLEEISLRSGQRLQRLLYDNEIWTIKSDDKIIAVYNPINFRQPLEILTIKDRNFSLEICTNLNRESRFLTRKDWLGRCCDTNEDSLPLNEIPKPKERRIKKVTVYSPMENYKSMGSCEVSCQPQLAFCLVDRKFLWDHFEPSQKAEFFPGLQFFSKFDTPINRSW